MTIQDIEHLFDYNRWANRRVWQCVLPLTETQFHQSSTYSIGSVQQQVVHTMLVEDLWLQRIRGTPLVSFPSADMFPTRESIRVRWDAIEQDWIKYIAGLTNEALNAEIKYMSIKDHQLRYAPLGLVLSHVINHSTDHRAQTLALIHSLGSPTIEQDIIFYWWEKNPQPAS